MTLGQFAVAVGASPRWILNARASLALPAGYDVDGARRLGLAREVQLVTACPLTDAYQIAGEALDSGTATATIRENADGSVGIVIDVGRYLSTFNARLAVARGQYAQKKRGPRKRRQRDKVAAAREYGVDLGLLRESLALTPEHRLRRLDSAVAFFREARRAE